MLETSVSEKLRISNGVIMGDAGKKRKSKGEDPSLAYDQRQKMKTFHFFLSLIASSYPYSKDFLFDRVVHIFNVPYVKP